MALTISERRYQDIRRLVQEKQEAGEVATVLVENTEPERSFTTVESFVAYLDSLVE